MPTTRLISLDAFRGLTMAAMILANNPGSWEHIYPPLEHATWHGCTLTDLIFPFFLFIVGVAIPFSQAARQSRGDGMVKLAGGVFSRSVSLVLLGLLLSGVPMRLPDALPPGFNSLRWLQVAAVLFVPVGFLLLLWPWKSVRASAIAVAVVAAGWLALYFSLNRAIADAAPSLPAYDFGAGFYDPRAQRFPGVLQRIAVCYLVAAIANLIFGRNLLALLLVACCAAYAVLMSKVGFGGSIPGSWERATNLAHIIDVWSFGPHAYKSYADPEGLLSTLPAIGTTLVGLLAGRMLLGAEPVVERCARLMTWGVLLAIVGVLLDWWAMPVNKQIWTPSYVAYTAGLACLTLGTMFYIIDVRGRRIWATPLVAFGMNAILVFLLAGILGRIMPLIRLPAEALPSSSAVSTGATVPVRFVMTSWARHLQQSWTPAEWHSPEAASLAYAGGFLIILWLLCLVLHKLRWTLRV